MANVKFKIPKAIGAAADLLYETRQQRLEAQKAVDFLEEQEKLLKDHIIKNLPKSQASGVAGKVARVAVVPKEVPQVKDWDKFYKYLGKTGSFELLQRRLSDAAIKERWEAGEDVPGVEVFRAVSVSVTKV